MRLFSLAWSFIVLLPLLSQAQDYDFPAEKISIKTPADVASKRQKMISYVWGVHGWPTSRVLDDIDTDINGDRYEQLKTPEGNLLRIDRYTIEMDHGFSATVDHFIPINGNGKLFIYHAGHGYGYAFEDWAVNNNHEDAGLVIPGVLARGYSVLAFSMPLNGEPVPTEPVPNETQDEWQQFSSLGHIQMFEYLDHPYKYFADPLVISLNYVEDEYNYSDIYMTGLSGGGWTSTFYPALDPRIRFSFPVAGSVPLYLRKGHEGYGDAEQGVDYEGLLGVVNYEEMYVLGSYGDGRGQFQLTNRYDDCCFYDNVRNLIWVDSVKTKIDDLGAGRYNYFLEDSIQHHEISPRSFRQILKFIDYYESNDEPLTISEARADVLFVGDSTTFEVDARNPDVTFTWQVNQNNGLGFVDLEDDDHYRITDKILYIDSVEYSMHNFMYRCMIEGDHVPTTTTYSLTLKVFNPPGIMEPLAKIAACPGGPASFTILATGDSLRYQWQMSNEEGTDFEDLGESDLWSGANTDTLNVVDIDNLITRKFRCVVSNIYGDEITSNATTFTVREPTKVDFLVLPGTLYRCDPPATLVPSLTGGVFTGPGVQGDQFDPIDVEPGNVMINYEYVDDGGCTVTFEKSVLVNACDDDTLAPLNVVVAPNPTEGLISVNLRTEQATSIRLEVYNHTGQSLNSQTLDVDAGFQLFNLDLSAHPAGVYVVVVYCDGQVIPTRIVIR